MRMWHLLVAVLGTAIVLKVWESEPGRVAVVVFAMGLGLTVFGSTGLLALFRAFASIGAARGHADHVEAIVSTALVLLLATAAMSGVFFVGVALLRAILT